MNFNQCSQIGCTRESSVEIPILGNPVNAPQGSTEMKRKVCLPCAQDIQRMLEFNN